MYIIKLSAYYLIEIIEYLVIIRCILSWFPVSQNILVKLLYDLTDPILTPVRKLMEKTFGYMQIDFSPIVVFLLLDLIQRLIMSLWS